MIEKTYLSLHEYWDCEPEGGEVLSLPIYIGRDILVQELELCIQTVGCHSFVSYKQLPALELMLYIVLDKLEFFALAHPEEARAAGEKMIQILSALGTDDDIFPEFQIKRIKSIIE